jgi:hypothetical protein
MVNQIQGGLWWRFDRYEVRAGYIRPAPGASLQEYDPWQEFGPNRTHSRRDVAPPYQSLLALLDAVSIQPGSSETPLGFTPKSETKVLNWCANHGLLGVLPHRVQSVTLSPRWEPWPEIKTAEDFDERPAGPVHCPTLRSYHRWALGWRTSLKPNSDHRVTPVELIEGPGPIASNKLWSSDWPLRPKVHLQSLRMEDWSEEPLSKTWGRFFPDVSAEEKETFAYPEPTSAEFWCHYGESVEDFLNAAFAIRDALQKLKHIKPQAESTEETERHVLEGMKILYALVSPVRTIVEPLTNGTYDQRWVSPSLLASFAMMALQDVAAQKRILNCETCRSLFLSTSPRARYCTTTCRHTAQKRRYRAKKKENENG